MMATSVVHPSSLYWENVKEKYLRIFISESSKIIDRISTTHFDKFLNDAYSSGIVSFTTKDNIVTTSGITKYQQASDLLHKIDGSLRHVDPVNARIIVLRICKILWSLDDPVLKVTSKEILGQLSEVPEIVAISLCSLDEFKMLLQELDIKVFIEHLQAEKLILDVASVKTPLNNQLDEPHLLVYKEIVRSVALDPSRLGKLIALLQSQGSIATAKLAHELTEEYSKCLKILGSFEDGEGGVFQHTEASRPAGILPQQESPSAQRFRIPSDVDRSMMDMLTRYDDLISKIINSFKKASEQKPQTCGLDQIKAKLKRPLKYRSHREFIETSTSVEDLIQFAAEKHSSLLDVGHLFWLVDEFEVSDGRTEIEDYNGELKRFLKNTRADLMNNVHISKADFTNAETIVFTIRRNLNEILMAEVKEIIKEIFEDELSEYVVVNVVGRTRSITIVCYAPEPIIGLLIRKVQQNLKTLQEKGLMSMKIGYCTLLDFENDKVAVACESEESTTDVLCSDMERTQEELSLATEQIQESSKESQQLLVKEVKSLTQEKRTEEIRDESQDHGTTEEIKKLRKENEELLAKIGRHENLTAIIQQRKQENETLQQIIEERNKEIETLRMTIEEKEAMGRTSEADKQHKEEPKQEDATLVEDELKRSSEDQLYYEQNIESLKIKELDEKIEFLEKEKERGRSELESVQEQLEKKKKTLETVKEMRRKVLRENEQQKDEIKKNKETIQEKEEELNALNEEYKKLDANFTAITKEKDELQQSKDDVEKKISKTEKEKDDLRVECQELQTSSIKLKGEYDTLQGEYGTLQGEFNKRPPSLAFYHPSHTHYVPVTMVMTNFKDYKKNNIQWFSPGFYTRPEGYKLCVKVDAHGRNSGRGTHVSAYVHLMQGEYDDRLTWPFTAKIQLELLNRQADENHRMFTAEFNESRDIVSRSRIMGAGIITDSGSLAREGEGEDRLISHEDLGYNSSTFTEFLKDDSIYIRVKSVDIQMATEIPPSTVPLHTTYPTDKFILKEFSKLKAKNKEWQSDPFYTHKKGYKFVLVVQPNGEYTYKGRYIAMFLHITRGEYDDQLVFPFRGNIYVHLVNQVDDQNHSEFLVKYDEKSDPKGKHGGRVPRFNFGERSSEGWGTASLIRHDLLPYNKYRGTQYLTDNDEIEFRIHKIEVFSG